MTDDISLVFWIGAGLFALSTIFFVVLESGRRLGTAYFRHEVFISFITTISYVVMAIDLATVTAINGEPIYWTRWLFYIGSCSILAAEAVRIEGGIGSRVVEVITFTSLVMFCGFLASFMTTEGRWWFFGLSSAAYIGLPYVLIRGASGRRTVGVLWFILIFWSLFPVVWVLDPTGFALITTYVGAILYLALDIVTKIAFGLYVVLRIKEKRTEA